MAGEFLLDSRREKKIIGGVRICVIFNPVARGDKARHFRDWLNGVASECALKPTQRAGDARRLAAEAVAEKFDTIVAAGGDGTVNEVLNGIGDAPSLPQGSYGGAGAPDGFANARLGVLPLGTVNVFARELKIPMDIAAAWEILRRGREMKIDLPCAEFFADGKPVKLFFAQLAGAGLDTRAIELVNWRHKKAVGPLAYVIAGLKALAERKSPVIVQAGSEKISGELVLLGNGKLYGGDFQIFPAADLRDGRLDVCVFPRVHFWTLLRVAPGLLLRKRISGKFVRRLAAEKILLTGEGSAAFELDGEWAGRLPVTFSVAREKLRVVVP